MSSETNGPTPERAETQSNEVGSARGRHESQRTPPNTRARADRRTFLAGATATLTALAGCTFNVNVGGGGGGSQPSTPQTPRPTATATPTSAPTPTATETPTATPTATPESELDVVVLTVQPEIGDVVLYTIAPTAERYRVDRFYLYVESASDGVLDGPNSEELYGEITVSATDGENTVETVHGQGRVWDVDENNAREISEGNGRLLTLDFSPVEFVFPDTGSIDRSQAYIEVSADLWEADKGANSDDHFTMWKSQNRWYLDDNPSPDGYVADNGESFFKLEFSDGGSLVNLTYNVTKV